MLPMTRPSWRWKGRDCICEYYSRWRCHRKIWLLLTKKNEPIALIIVDSSSFWWIRWLMIDGCWFMVHSRTGSFRPLIIPRFVSIGSPTQDYTWRSVLCSRWSIFVPCFAFPTLSHPPLGTSPLPPLVFIHGSYHAAWCWGEHWMPFLASKGYETYSISLRGTSGTPPPGLEVINPQVTS